MGVAIGALLFVDTSALTGAVVGADVGSSLETAATVGGDDEASVPFSEGGADLNRVGGGDGLALGHDEGETVGATVGATVSMGGIVGAAVMHPPL